MSERIPRDIQVEQLFDYAVNHTNGFTYVDVERDLGWDRPHFFDVARALRRVFSGDSINLVCSPQAKGDPWLYELVGQVGAAEPWVANRLRDMKTRLVTMASVASTLENATDGRTLQGREARKINRALTRLVEDLDDIRNNA